MSDRPGEGASGLEPGDSAYRTVVTSAPSRTSRSRGVVVVMTGVEVGRVFSLTEAVNTLGRADECNVRLSDDGLSRIHAQIVRVAGNWMLTDKGSTNGTYLNDVRVQSPSRLKDGDRVQIGATATLRFSLVDEAEERALRQVYEAAMRDALTGVANRTHFEERIDSEIAFAVRHKAQLSVVLFDVDHFKRVNDTYGHLAGDEGLRNVGALLSSSVRTEDLVARYGGEEFVVVARGIDVAGAQLMADRLRVVLGQRPVEFQGHRISVTASGGVASLDCCGEQRNKSTLLATADARLYQAKQAGRNRVVGRG